VAAPGPGRQDSQVISWSVKS